MLKSGAKIAQASPLSRKHVILLRVGGDGSLYEQNGGRDQLSL